MIEITAPNGAVIAFPEGTGEDEIRRVMASLDSEPPTQRLRALAQGATFGLSDEAIAAVMNPVSAARAAMGDEAGGQAYSEALASERAKLKQYQDAYPLASLGYELGGAAVPSAVGALFSGGTSTVANAPLLARAVAAAPRMAAAGAAAGGAYGFGTAEGGAVERAKGAGIGAAAGAVMAPLLGAATYPALAGVSRVADAARRLLGDRGGKAVEAEVQRLVEQTGLTPDEIVQRVASGEIMAENATLRMAVRAMMARGGEGEAMVRGTMTRRPPQTRAEAMAEIQQHLSSTQDENVLRGMRASQADARAAEGDAFAQLFADNGGGVVSDDVVAAMADAVQRMPGVATELQRFTRAQTGTNPYYTVDDNGVATFTRQPTVQEAEVMRRFLAGKADEAYRGGSPWGEVYKTAERAIRNPLDATSPELSQLRSRWAKLATERDAFEQGRKAFNMTADEVEITMDGLLARGDEGAAALAAFRSGAMDALRTKAKGAGGTNLMATITNPERKESAILRAIMPPDAYETAASRAAVAAQSQAASNEIVRGSSTELTRAAGTRLGAQLNAEEMANAVRGDFGAMLRVGTKIVQQAAPGLSDKDRVRVLGILLSEDPQVVRRALTDESGAAMLRDAIVGAAARLRQGATGAGVVGGAMFGDTVVRGR